LPRGGYQLGRDAVRCGHCQPASLAVPPVTYSSPEQGVYMAYEMITSWATGDQVTSQPRGWYRDAAGYLRFWDGQAWAGALSVEAKVPATDGGGGHSAGARVWRVGAMVLGWIGAIIFLGLVLSSAHAIGVDCGTIFNPVAVSSDRFQPICGAAIDSRERFAGLAAILTIVCFASSRWPAAPLVRPFCLGMP